MLESLSHRQHRLLTTVLAILLVTSAVGSLLNVELVEPASTASTSADWTQPTDVTTAVATDPSAFAHSSGISRSPRSRPRSNSRLRNSVIR